MARGKKKTYVGQNKETKQYPIWSYEKQKKIIIEMLTIPELLDRWILKNLANYPDIYHVSIKKQNLRIWFWVSFRTPVTKSDS